MTNTYELNYPLRDGEKPTTIHESNNDLARGLTVKELHLTQAEMQMLFGKK